MAKLDFKGTEFDTFFQNKPEQNKENLKLQKSKKAELQNSEITEKQKSVKTETSKTTAKRNDPNYVRVTTAIKKSTFLKIKEFLYNNKDKVKTFDDALELFLSDQPINL